MSGWQFAAQVWASMAPYLLSLITFAAICFAAWLLGDPLIELVRLILGEIRGAFAQQPLALLNLLSMVLFVGLAFALFIPSPVSEAVGLARHDTDSETMQQFRLGAACFVV